MTTDSTQPQPELGPAPDNGQGQSHGYRRRRRRRKNKSSQQGAPQAQQGQPAPPPQQAQAPAHPKPARSDAQQGAHQSPHQGPNQGLHQGPHQGPHQGQGRRKKKFFQKSQGPPPSPGNSISERGQGKRKNKPKGPREFVGPMDHSYRAVNGNVADGPPSTIQLGSNSHSAYYHDAYQPPAAPVREDAPTRIFCFIEDLFFLAKIQETSRKLGVKVEFVKGDKEVVTRILEAPENERPTLLVFDLNNLNAKPMTLIPKFRTKFKKAVSIIGFLSHLQGDLKMKGVEAGCDVVMPRSAFSQSLPNLLRRYGLEEEEDHAHQPV
jgi:hypothetical protein